MSTDVLEKNSQNDTLFTLIEEIRISIALNVDEKILVHKEKLITILQFLQESQKIREILKESLEREEYSQ